MTEANYRNGQVYMGRVPKSRISSLTEKACSPNTVLVLGMSKEGQSSDLAE